MGCLCLGGDEGKGGGRKGKKTGKNLKLVRTGSSPRCRARRVPTHPLARDRLVTFVIPPAIAPPSSRPSKPLTMPPISPNIAGTRRLGWRG